MNFVTVDIYDSTIGGNLVIFETRYYYYFLPSFQKKVGNTITKYLVLKNY